MQRELSYQVSFERLVKVGRSAGRKAYRTFWLLFWLTVAAYVTVILGLALYADELSRWMEAAGIRFSVEIEFGTAAVFFVMAVWLLRRFRLRQSKGRADYNQTTRLTLDDSGLRFAADDIEHYLKWSAISQLMLERDGVVISHGKMFYFVPDAAFANMEERLAFIRRVYGRLSEKARSISEKYIRPSLVAERSKSS